MVNPDDLSDFTIIDFELSGQIGKDKRTMSGAGGFSAPEVRCGNLVGKDADVFSLGKIMDSFFSDFSADDEIYDLISEMTNEDAEQRLSLDLAIGRLEYILEDFNLDYPKLNKTAPILTREVRGSYVEDDVLGYESSLF